MKEIVLTKGQVALVDDADYEWLCRFKWCAKLCRGKFYAARGVRVASRKYTVYMHRLVMQAQPGREVDHINGATLDNRRENLRLCTHGDNIRHMRKPHRNSTSRYRGVYLNKKSRRWIAQIRWNRKAMFLGSFASEDEAALFYNAKASEYYGEYATLNIVGETS